MPDTFAINTFPYIWDRSLEDCLSHMADQGHREFEILLSAPHAWPDEIDRETCRRVCALLAQRGLKIVSINPGGFDNNLASPARSVRTFAVDYLEKAIALAAEWGAPDVILSPGVGRPLLPPPQDSIRGWFLDSLQRLLPTARQNGVHLLIENIPYSFVPRAEQIAEMVEAVADSHFGIVYDAANAVFVSEDPVAGFDRVFPHMRLLHLSDTGTNVWRHDRVGRGVVPFADVLRRARQVGFDGPTVIEIIDVDGDAAIAESIALLHAMQAASGT